MTRRDDVAQVVLRALLAWPLLGVVLGEVTRGGAARLFGVDLVRATLFGAGAGLAAGLVAAAVELSVAPLGRRSPLLRAGLELALLAALAPAAHLGGAFALVLQATGSSAEATTQVVEAYQEHPERFLTADAALSAGLVLSGLVVGRALGWGPAAQAALGAWTVVVGLLARLAAGRLEAVPLLLVLAVEGTGATLAPYLLAVADRVVRAARQLHARGAGDGARRKLAGLLVVAGLPIAVAASWSFALRRGLPPDPGLAWLFPAVVTCGVVLALQLARVGGRAPAATPARALLALAPVAALAVGLATCTGPMGGLLTTGWHGRATLGLRLGVKPARLLRWAEGASDRSGPDGWLDLVRLPRRNQVLVEQLRPLLVRAADEGDVGACLLLTELPTDRGFGPELTSDARRWLRSLIAAGEVQGAERLLWARGDPGSDEEAAADLLLDAARRSSDESRGPYLAWLVWSRCPGRRPAVEALIAADTLRFSRLLWDLLRDTTPPPRPLLRVFLERLRAADEGPDDRRARGLGARVLHADPTLARPGDTTLLGPEREPPPGWAAPLATADLRPLDPERDPALAAAARADWAAVWSLSTAVDDGLRDEGRDAPLLRARARAVLAEARTARSARGALALARCLLVAAGAERRVDAAAVFDLLVHDLHVNLCPTPATRTGVSAELLTRLDLVDALGLTPEQAERVEGARALIVRLFGPPDPEVLAGQRRALVRALRADEARGDAAAGRVADRLEARR